MAKYSVNCEVCSNSFTVDLVGKTRDRQWKLDHWTWICDDCKEKTRQEENKKASETNKKAGLPELVGTEKQIAWAETIRSKIITWIDGVIKKGELLSTYPKETVQEFLEENDIDPKKVDIAYQNITNQTKSSWWIDNRNVPLHLWFQHQIEDANQ